MSVEVRPQELPKKHARRWYSEKEKADALAAVDANGGSIWVTAKKLSIPYVTLKLWVAAGTTGNGDQRPKLPVTTTEVLTESKRDLLQALDRSRWLYLDRLSEPKAVEQTSGYYAAITFKTLNEAHQLLSGNATSRTELSLASFLESGSYALPSGDDVEVIESTSTSAPPTD